MKWRALAVKKNFALILGLICIAVSAVTLFSVLSHGDSAISTFTFLDSSDGTTSWVTDASISSSNANVLKLEISTVTVPRVGPISEIFIQFADQYEASVARDLFSKQEMDLAASYVRFSTGTKYQVVPFVNAESKADGDKIPQAPLLFPDKVYVTQGNNARTLQEVVSKQVRLNQINQGIYVGAYGKMMWTIDGILCRGKINEKNPCHNHEPIVK